MTEYNIINTSLRTYMAKGLRINPVDYQDVKSISDKLDEEVRRFVESRPYEDTEGYFNSFVEEAISSYVTHTPTDTKGNETDVFISFGKTNRMIISGIELNRSNFIYHVNQHCRAYHFYKVVRNDADNSIHFIQTRPVSEQTLRHLFLGIVSTIARIKGTLEAKARAAVFKDLIQRTQRGWTVTLIENDENIFWKEVNLSVDNEGVIERHNAFFADPVRYRSVMNRVEEKAKGFRDNTYNVDEELVSLVKKEADLFFTNTGAKRDTAMDYYDIVSQFKDEYVRIPIRVCAKDAFAELEREVIENPTVSSWVTLYEEAKELYGIRVVKSLDLL